MIKIVEENFSGLIKVGAVHRMGLVQYRIIYVVAESRELDFIKRYQFMAAFWVPS